MTRCGRKEFVVNASLADKQTALEKGQEICKLIKKKKLAAANGKHIIVIASVCHVNLIPEITLHDYIKTADET